MSHGLPGPGFPLNSLGYTAHLVTEWLEKVIREKQIAPTSFPVVAARELRPFFGSALKCFVWSTNQVAVPNLPDVLHDYQNAVRILESIGHGHGDEGGQKRVLKALHSLLGKPRMTRSLKKVELEFAGILRDFCCQITDDANSQHYGRVVGGCSRDDMVVGGKIVRR